MFGALFAESQIWTGPQELSSTWNEPCTDLGSLQARGWLGKESYLRLTKAQIDIIYYTFPRGFRTWFTSV